MPGSATSSSLSPLLLNMEENLCGHISFIQRCMPGMKVLDQEDLLLVDSGLPSDTFNKIARARLTYSNIDARINQAIDHFRAAGRPFAWCVGPCSRPFDIEARLREHGLHAAELELSMAAHLRNLRNPNHSLEDLVVERATTIKHIADFSQVLSESWNPPDLAVKLFYSQAAPLLIAADCPMRLFVGYFDGEAVSASELFIGAGVAGIYSVATRKPFQRRGVGSVLAWAAADAARREGIPIAVLQSSEVAKGIYSRLGFKSCCRFTEYTPKE